MAAVHTSGELTNSLHGVSLLDEELGSGDVNVHAERLLLFVNWLCWTSVFTEEHKTKENFIITSSCHRELSMHSAVCTLR